MIVPGRGTTSWRSLVDEAGTPWGSIRHHFPGGKDGLGLAAIEVGSELPEPSIQRA
jgi:TetR/AcrR family transcriptional regulator, lmrAB and yxaGH operons repressor